MKYEGNQCCGCSVPAYPCMGDSCPNRHVVLFKCDNCGADDLTANDVFLYEDGEFCSVCAEEMYPDQFESEDTRGCDECIHCTEETPNGCYHDKDTCRECGTIKDGKPIDNFKAREE